MLILPPMNLRKVWISFWKLYGWGKMCCIQLEFHGFANQNFQLHLRERRFNEVFSVPSVVTLVVVVLRSCGATGGRILIQKNQPNRPFGFSAQRGEHLVKLPFLARLLSNPLISFQVIRVWYGSNGSEGKIHVLRLGSWKLTQYIVTGMRDGGGLPKISLLIFNHSIPTCYLFKLNHACFISQFLPVQIKKTEILLQIKRWRKHPKKHPTTVLCDVCWHVSPGIPWGNPWMKTNGRLNVHRFVPAPWQAVLQGAEMYIADIFFRQRRSHII